MKGYKTMYGKLQSGTKLAGKVRRTAYPAPTGGYVKGKAGR